MGLLTGGAKGVFGELMGPLYLAARLTDRTLAYGNDGTIQAGAEPRDCKAKVDSATTRMRESPGYAETDRAIYILATSVSGDVDTDAEIEILEGDYAGEKFGIASVDRPPGCSYFLCRGTRVGEA